jgi:putative polyhydroxyalkanoate system protein
MRPILACFRPAHGTVATNLYQKTDFMANIHIKRSHSLPRDEARARVEEIAEDLKKKLDAKYAWKGDSLQFHRSGASGTIDVKDDYIDLRIKLGLLLTPMKGKIEATILEHMNAALAGNGKTKFT